MSEEIKKEAQDVELTPDELDKVAGGAIIEQIFRHEIYGEQKRYSVYNELTGKLIATTQDKETAIKLAEATGVSTDIVTYVYEMNN